MEKFVEVVATATGRKQFVPADWLDHPVLSRGFELPPSQTPSERWTVERLTGYAEDHGVDLGGATLKADILAVLAPSDPDAPAAVQVVAETPAAGDQEE